MPRFLFIILLLATVLSSCESARDPDPSLAGWDFYPLETGRFWEYSIKEVIIRPNLPNDTLLYELRTELVDSYTNQAGTTSFIMYRYEKAETSDEWTYSATWTLRQDPGRLVVYEETVPYLKLSFPVRDGRTWDGNSLNSDSEDTYVAERLDDAVLLPDGTTTSGVTIIQEDFLDLVIGVEDRRQEQYARNVGLTVREIRQINYCLGPTCTGPEVPESGIDYLQVLINYGTVN